MANLNLSEFTEKLFVADADHTFIWDSAMSISKRVSRNSWLNSGTLTSDAPVTISQTWNNAAVAFTGVKFNAAGTSDANSATASKLLDLQIGNVSKFSVDKYGITTSFGAFRQTPTGAGINVSANGSRLALLSNNAEVAYLTDLNFILHASAFFGWSSGAASSGAFDTILLRDGAANTLALRNGAAAQTFNVYGTYTSGTSYERLTLSAPSAANAIIGTNKGSGGGTARGLEFQTDGVTRMTIPATTGTVNFPNGISSAAGATSVFQNANAIVFSLTGGTYNGTSTVGFFSPSDGVLRITNNAVTDFNRIQLGGTTDAFPAIARDGAGIKFTGAAAGATAWIKVPPVAVSALPLAATAGAGARAFVNDALAPTFGNAVTGGGAVLVPVYSDGSAWNVG